MAGIFGAWNVDGRPLERSLVARMSAALAHRGPDAEFVHPSNSVALGCRALDGTAIGMPASARVPSRSHVVFDGRLDNRTDLIDALRATADVSAATDDAELAAYCYATHGLDFVWHLAGDFALALFDTDTRALILARDAIGIRPLYFHRAGNAIRFASEIKALLADDDIRPRPNDRLLAELLMRRLHRRDHDGSTLFEGIAGVPPAHVAILTPARTDVRRYWDFADAPSTPARTFESYAEEMRFHFERAVVRRLRGARPTAIAVSGGVDSSAIYCVARRAAPDSVRGFTYAPRGGPDDESPYVAALERECGQRITIVAAAPGEIGVSRAAELIRRVETPMSNAQWHRADRLVGAVRESGAGTLMTGHWGDQLLFDQSYLVDLLHRGSWSTIGAHLRAYRDWFPGAGHREFTGRLVADLLENDLPRWVRVGIRAARRASTSPAAWDDWFSDRFRSMAGPDVFEHQAGSTALARALYREVRSRYHELCLAWHNAMAAAHGVERTFPFLDRDLIQFVMSVPGTVLARNGVPKALLREALHGVVPRAILERRTKGDFTEGTNAASREEYAATTRVLTADAMVVQLGYVDADKLIRGMRAAAAVMDQSSTCAASWRVTALLAFEIWLQEFVAPAARQRREAEHEKVTAS